MANEKTVGITASIEGRSPLLLNRFGEEAAEKATSGSAAVQVGHKGSPQEQAEKKLYLGSDGKTPIVPGPNLLRCFIDAGKFFKAGKSKITTMKTSLVPACLQIEEMEIPIQHVDPWSVDSRPVRIPSTGGRILCYRPYFNDWRLDFTMVLDQSLISAKVMYEIVEAAGQRIGLGDFRPDCKGPFGKFKIVSWAVRDLAQAA